MTAFRPLTIVRKLKKLDEVIRQLEGVKTYKREEFLSNKVLQAATERFFILGIEIITDVGDHLLTEKKNVSSESYDEIISALGKTKLVPAALSKRNAGMARFRNLLVHVYDEIEPKLVHDYLQKAPREFRAFAKAFVKHL
ncbi:MAG: DUF86 domain-containing protein [Patescibacteria group bacterium]